MMPFMTSSSLALTEASIDAYYPAYDVHIVDKPITGYLETPYKQTIASALPKYNVLMAAEIGYEWYVSAKSCVGLQAYVDVGVWNNKSQITNLQSPIISVSPITDASNPTPAVTVNSPQGLVASSRYLDFGLRAYYAFSVSDSSKKAPKKKNYHYYRRHDTKDHKNRYLAY